MVFTTVNAETAALPRASSVAIDDRLMGRLVGESLLKLGHVKTAVFGSNPVAGDSLAMRYQGLCEAYAERGLEHDRTLYREPGNAHGAEPGQFLRNPPHGTVTPAHSFPIRIPACAVHKGSP